MISLNNIGTWLFSHFEILLKCDGSLPLKNNSNCLLKDFVITLLPLFKKNTKNLILAFLKFERTFNRSFFSYFSVISLKVASKSPPKPCHFSSVFSMT